MDIATVKKNYEDIKHMVASMEEDAMKFLEKGNATAGTRLRKELQNIKNTAQDMRINVQAVKNKG